MKNNRIFGIILLVCCICCICNSSMAVASSYTTGGTTDSKNGTTSGYLGNTAKESSTYYNDAIKLNDDELKDAYNKVADDWKDIQDRYSNADDSGKKTLGEEYGTIEAKYEGYKQAYIEKIGPIPVEDKPSTGVLGEAPEVSANHTPDEIMGEAENFVNAGNKQNAKLDGKGLKDASNTLYNMLLLIGIFLALAIGMYLGIKFMLSSAEDRAKVKESLIPYIAGCIVIFGAFIIWKVAISLLSRIA